MPESVPVLLADFAALWKVTLPTGTKGKPDEYAGSALVAQLGKTRWFRANDTGDGIVFGAPVNGITTKGSKFPRGELRELNADGSLAAWSSTADGPHTIAVVESFTHMPNPRTDGGTAGVVGTQIHDGSDDISVFRCEGSKLWVTKGDTTHFALADPAYVAGTPYEAKFVVDNGVVSAYYNGQLVVSFPAAGTGWYFKAGAYVQANADNSQPGDATNYGETVVYSVQVAHGAPVPPVVTPPVVVPPVSPPTQPIPPVVSAPVGPVVLVMRHGEGGDLAHTLDADGLARAAAIPSLFLPHPEAGLYEPTAIYASEGKTKSLRPLQTVTPLAAALGELVVTFYPASSAKTLGKFLAKVTSGVHCVCWAHEDIPALTKALGKSTPKAPTSWPDDRYDVILVFVGDGAGNWSLTQVFQMLETGDVEVAI